MSLYLYRVVSRDQAYLDTSEHLLTSYVYVVLE